MADLDWQEINTEFGNKNLAKLYKSYIEARDYANLSRIAFEEVLIPKLEKATPSGHKPKFAYRWGKLSVAYVPKGKVARTSNGPDNRLII